MSGVSKQCLVLVTLPVFVNISKTKHYLTYNMGQKN